MTTNWCKNCAMGKNCPGYSKLPHEDCVYFLPMRLDGSVNFEIGEQ